jgi:putative hydrolase of the HAD superfamily
MNVNTIVFDLDDTLYNEITFVHSGFRAVAEYFLPLDSAALFEAMIQTLERNGRGRVFDDALQKLGLYSKTNVKKALRVYRSHDPKIELNTDAKEIFSHYRIQKRPLYIVTDGNKNVQANKIKALGADRWVKKSFITHRFGRIHAKPSPYCFIKIAEIEALRYEEIVYVADNVNKDFVQIKELGFRTIRIKQGVFANAKRPQKFQAEQEIESLLELKHILRE